MLCDAATVRDGLLHVLGGGLNILWREAYPASMASVLALMIEGEVSEVPPGRTLAIAARLSADDADGPVVAEVNGSLTAGHAKSGGSNFITPVVFDMSPISLPGPGSYIVQVQLEQLEPVSLTFDSEYFDGRERESHSPVG